VAKQGHIVGRGMYFGDDFLLTAYFRPYVVRTLTYTDCFLLESTVLKRLFQYGQFPRLQVRVRMLRLTTPSHSFLLLNIALVCSGLFQKRINRWKSRLILQSKVVPYAKAVLYVLHWHTASEL
jgi:hypothetical protein